MVKTAISCLLLSLTLCANPYERYCLPCHQKLPVDIDKFFYRYLLEYSSETAVKKALFRYLKNPRRKSTVMTEAFIQRFGIKAPSPLPEPVLREAIDVYWKTYQVFGKLK